MGFGVWGLGFGVWVWGFMFGVCILAIGFSIFEFLVLFGVLGSKFTMPGFALFLIVPCTSRVRCARDQRLMARESSG